MKAFPVIVGLVALLTFCSVDAAPVRAPTTPHYGTKPDHSAPPQYYTVMNGSRVVLKCDYDGDHPNQVLWVQGKSGVVPWDHADFFTIARTSDPDLRGGYHVESNDHSSSLIMEEATVDGSNSGRPGCYKCVVDLSKESHFHVSVVENDLFCWLVGAAGRDTFPVGTFLDIECGITRDREPFGKLEFSLSVGNETVQTIDVYGVTFEIANDTIATVHFKLWLKESYHGQNVHVALKLNNFGAEVGETALKYVVAERLLIGPYPEAENQDVTDKCFCSEPAHWRWLRFGAGALVGFCVIGMWMNR